MHGIPRHIHKSERRRRRRHRSIASNALMNKQLDEVLRMSNANDANSCQRSDGYRNAHINVVRLIVTTFGFLSSFRGNYVQFSSVAILRCELT